MVEKQFYKTQLFKDYEDNFDFISQFDKIERKFFHNVDTLVFTANVSVVGGYPTPKLVDFLSSSQEYVLEKGEEQAYSFNGVDYYIEPFGISHYRYWLSSKNRYNVFFMHRLSRLTDMPIMVRLSSEFLWFYGEVEACRIVFEELDRFLKCFDTSLGQIKASRIDYAHHTNSIQNMTKFFSNVDDFVVTRFDRHQLLYRDFPDLPSELVTYYHGLRGGKTVFLRIYDKTREVIEQGYKQFFLKFWLENGLISKYDVYLLENMYSTKNFEKQYLYRIKYYLEYGKIEEYKSKCKFYLNEKNKYELKDLVEFADFLTPPLTRILNIEFEVGSKFFKSSVDYFSTLTNIENVVSNQQIFYKILLSKSTILDYLTSKTYRWVSSTGAKLKRQRDYHSLWKRLRRTNMFRFENDKEFYRTYQRNRDVELLKRQLLHKLANISILSKGDNDDDLDTDITDMLSSLSESAVRDMQAYKMTRIKLLKNQLEK